MSGYRAVYRKTQINSFNFPSLKDLHHHLTKFSYISIKPSLNKCEDYPAPDHDFTSYKNSSALEMLKFASFPVTKTDQIFLFCSGI